MAKINGGKNEKTKCIECCFRFYAADFFDSMCWGFFCRFGYQPDNRGKHVNGFFN